MCGIAGQADLRDGGVDVHEVAAMVEVLAHRGPDGAGVEVLATTGGTPAVILGHRRLAVIDLSEAGAQPLTNEDGSVAVVFNGEIYNFRELRRQLETRGHVFRSHTDTEVIAHGYEEFGDDVVKHLDGMFAFALWDARRRRLLLARDRVGKKPLYYSSVGGRFVFASEIKALRACPWVDSGVAWARVPELLALGYVPWPRTLYEGILQVPPASTIVVDEGGLGEPAAYWWPPFATTRPEPEAGLGWDEAAERVRFLLRCAVERRLLSDVPLGVLLSGGLDSAAVVAMMAEIGVPIRTFTVGITGDPSYDERPFARLVAERFGTDHTEITVGVDAAALVERVLWHLDQPIADSSCLPTYLIAAEARKHVSVVLTGDGGDEVFGGYDRFRALLLAEQIPTLAQRPLATVSRLLPSSNAYGSARRRTERFAADVRATSKDRYCGWVRVMSDSQLSGLLADPALAGTADRSLGDAWGEAPSVGPLHRILHTNLRTYLHDDLLVKTDRMTMASSLEARSPLLDISLMEAVAALPAQMKTNAFRGKRILRRALAGTLPREILSRPKHGFGVPVGEWFRGSLLEPFADLVLAPDARINAITRRSAVTEMHDAHQAGKVDHGPRLWALLALETWLRSQEGPPTSRPPACRPLLKNQ